MKEKKNVVKKIEKKIKWRYTDDLIATILVIAWIVGKFCGNVVPDWILATALGYVFGKNIPVQK